MKITKLALLFLLTTFTFSCSDDDSSASEPENFLLGDWKMSGLDFTGNATLTTFSGEGKDFNAVFSFSENPNEVSSTGDYNIDLTTTVLGQTMTQTVPSTFIDGALDTQGTSTWTLAGDQLTFSNDVQVNTFTVVTLTADMMTLLFDDTATVMLPTGESQTVNIDATINFIR